MLHSPTSKAEPNDAATTSMSGECIIYLAYTLHRHIALIKDKLEFFCDLFTENSRSHGFAKGNALIPVDQNFLSL